MPHPCCLTAASVLFTAARSALLHSQSFYSCKAKGSFPIKITFILSKAFYPTFPTTYNIPNCALHSFFFFLLGLLIFECYFIILDSWNFNWKLIFETIVLLAQMDYLKWFHWGQWNLHSLFWFQNNFSNHWAAFAK